MYLISDNWKYPKASTSPQLKYSTFVWIKSHLQHLHHSVTLWLLLDFSRVLRMSGSSSKQTLFTSKPRGSYWNLIKVINCYLFVVKFNYKIDIFQKTYKLNRQIVSLKKYFFQWRGVVFISYTELFFTIRLIREVFPNQNNAPSNYLTQ